MLACFHLLILLLSTVVSAPDAKTIVHRVETKYRSARTLQATFLERYFENGRVVRTEAGVAYFHRPGKMRWEYESPEKNLFLVDGKSAWFYVPADHTVTRVPAKDSTDWRTPLALLAGEMKMSRVCARIGRATSEKSEALGHAVLACELRGTESTKKKQSAQQSSSQVDESGETVFFEVVEDSGELVKVSVRGPGGVSVEFHFANWQFEPPASEALFHFVAPPGVAIVNGELPSEDGRLNP